VALSLVSAGRGDILENKENIHVARHLRCKATATTQSFRTFTVLNDLKGQAFTHLRDTVVLLALIGPRYQRLQEPRTTNALSVSRQA
jgi:hypothetical protein